MYFSNTDEPVSRHTYRQKVSFRDVYNGGDAMEVVTLIMWCPTNGYHSGGVGFYVSFVCKESYMLEDVHKMASHTAGNSGRACSSAL